MKHLFELEPLPGHHLARAEADRTVRVERDLDEDEHVSRRGLRQIEHGIPAEVTVLRWTRQRYAPLLESALRHPRLVLGGSAALLALAAMLSLQLGQEFVPTLDEQDLAMHAVRIPGTGIETSTRMQMLTEKLVSDLSEVQVVFSKTGTSRQAELVALVLGGPAGRQD